MGNLLIVSKLKIPEDLRRQNGKDLFTSTFNKYYHIFILMMLSVTILLFCKPKGTNRHHTD